MCVIVTMGYLNRRPDTGKSRCRNVSYKLGLSIKSRTLTHSSDLFKGYDCVLVLAVQGCPHSMISYTSGVKLMMIALNCKRPSK